MKILAMSVATLSLLSCSGTEDENVSKVGSVNVNLVSASSLNLVNLPLTESFSLTSDFNHLKTGATSGLLSYKVYFKRIGLCEDITEEGSGYSDPINCVDLYVNNLDEYTGESDPTADDVTRFNAAGEGKFFDILSTTDLAALKTAMATAINVGSYNWGIMETHPWVKIKAKAGTFCTKSGGTLQGSGQFDSYMQVANLDCGTGGAEEALVYMVNGNSAFKFVNPLTVAEGTTVRADILFNLDDNVVFNQSSAGSLRDTGSNGFAVPFFNASPVLLANDDKIMKETYLFDISNVQNATIAGSPQFRLDLYYPKSDTTKTPVAVTASLIRTNELNKNASEKFDSITVENATIKLVDWKDTIPVTFTRTEAGTAATGSISCGKFMDPRYGWRDGIESSFSEDFF